MAFEATIRGASLPKIDLDFPAYERIPRGGEIAE
jgi:hypothetical protein